MRRSTTLLITKKKIFFYLKKKVVVVARGACAVPNLRIRIKYLCVAAVFFCILQRWTSGYILKRGRLKLRVVLASRKKVTEQEIEILEEEDGDDRQE